MTIDVSIYANPEGLGLSKTTCYCVLSGLPLYLCYDPFKKDAALYTHWIFNTADRIFRNEIDIICRNRVVESFNQNPTKCKLAAYAILIRLGCFRIHNFPGNWESMSLDQFVNICNIYSLFYHRKKDFISEIPVKVISDGNLKLDEVIDNLQVFFTQKYESFYFVSDGVRGDENKDKLPDFSKLTKRKKTQVERIEFTIGFWDALEVEISCDKDAEEIFPEEERRKFRAIIARPAEKAVLYSDTIRSTARKIHEGGWARNENGSPNFNALMVLKQIEKIDELDRNYFSKAFGESEDVVRVNYADGISIHLSNIGDQIADLVEDSESLDSGKVQGLVQGQPKSKVSLSTSASQENTSSEKLSPSKKKLKDYIRSLR